MAKEAERHPTIRIHRSVAERLREYSRSQGNKTGSHFSMAAFASAAILQALSAAQGMEGTNHPRQFVQGE